MNLSSALAWTTLATTIAGTFACSSASSRGSGSGSAGEGPGGAESAGGSGSGGTAPVGGSGSGGTGPVCGDTSSDEANCGACGTVCGQGLVCDGGSCEAPSCVGATTQCQNESCCASSPIEGGTFWMGAMQTVSATAQRVTVSSYVLDKYEVTVSRFRKFVAAYGEGWRPANGSGVHPNLNGSGQDAWNSDLPVGGVELAAAVRCSPSFQTWTNEEGDYEAAAVNCVDWYAAMAFCIWDGGYLPTEAEWEYAAAGGDEERTYPWSSATPTETLANYSPSGTPFQDVGSHPMGAGRWGQEDLAGGMWEWTLDWFGVFSQDGTVDPAQLTPSSARVTRSGSWNNDAGALAVTGRGSSTPTYRYQDAGFRCARPL